MVTLKSTKGKLDFNNLSRDGYEGPTLHAPNVYAGARPLAPGFYLFSGPTGSGKSTFSLALALIIAARMGSPISYRYMLEPRAASKDLDRFLGPNSAEATTGLLKSIADSGLKSVVLDSVTYLIPALGKKMMGDQEDVTMKAGLRRSDIVGVLAMDNLSRGFGLTVIGTVNSELFPRTSDLEGACEGSMTIRSLGQASLEIRDRMTRTKQTLQLPDAAVTTARQLLGYVTSTTAAKPTNLLEIAL
jgi:energy-coupling factor transporter ATP-binding protein EcfA2